jgi:subtilisin family serine protease
VLRVPAARVAQVEAAFAGRPGVKSVGLTGQPRYTTTVTAPAFTNDPYFTGFQTTAQLTNGTFPAPTYELLPIVESSNVPGQWDMHVTRLEYAFAYSLANNGSNVVDANALGSSSVKIAVIDTGQDTSHPELASKIAYQKCFITDTVGDQSTSNFTTDEDGHGTDVTGIAGEATNNSFGFTAAGGNSTIYAYRVFPTPDDNCAQEGSKDSQCGANGGDIASAIRDAVTQGVNVISMSLGGGTCDSSGNDQDAVEGAAVADAIAANVVVVAAAGNSTGPPVQAPGCDTGVIAVGATGLADGVPNGSKKLGGTPTAPIEYVASYTDNASLGAIPGSASAWGIVAPGGDPSNAANDTDDLHWIENIWTSTPFDTKNFGGDCEGDYPTPLTGTADCRVLIAGTSMATPHVAGAAALILAAAPQYQSPALMKQLLCATADDIGDSREGCGRLDVYRAMATALNDAVIPGPSPVP